MFYCPNCNNTYDIARSSMQTGGTFDFGTTDSSYETSNDEQIGGDKYSALLTSILENNKINVNELAKINVNDLIKSPEYKKLKTNEKEYIYNKIQEILPNDKKKMMVDKPDVNAKDNMAYFVCSSCGYSIEIKDGTKIFSRTADDLSQSYATGNYKNMLHSKILPHTRKYICPNDKCESHKDNTKREAVFFRKNNSYNVVTICKSCEAIF